MSEPSLHALPAIAPTEESAMRPAQRFDDSALVDRPKLKRPRGACMIAWPVVNIEERSIERPIGSIACVSGAAGRIAYFDAMLAYPRRHKDVLFRNGGRIRDGYAAQGQR